MQQSITPAPTCDLSRCSPPRESASAESAQGTRQAISLHQGGLNVTTAPATHRHESRGRGKGRGAMDTKHEETQQTPRASPASAHDGRGSRKTPGSTNLTPVHVTMVMRRMGARADTRAVLLLVLAAVLAPVRVHVRAARSRLLLPAQAAPVRWRALRSKLNKCKLASRGRLGSALYGSARNHLRNR